MYLSVMQFVSLRYVAACRGNVPLFYYSLATILVFTRTDCTLATRGSGVQVRHVETNTDAEFVDTCGHPLPPCIVMERGESLDIWVARAKPDRALAFAVRSHSSLLVCTFCFVNRCEGETVEEYGNVLCATHDCALGISPVTSYSGVTGKQLKNVAKGARRQEAKQVAVSTPAHKLPHVSAGATHSSGTNKITFRPAHAHTSKAHTHTHTKQRLLLYCDDSSAFCPVHSSTARLDVSNLL